MFVQLRHAKTISARSGRKRPVQKNAFHQWAHYPRDLFDTEMELRYFRDTDGREVSFCLTENLQPKMFVECKWRDSSTSKHLYYLKKKFPDAEYFQVSAVGTKSFADKNQIIHIPALSFSQNLI